jgi:hypothetical protein
MTLSKVNSHDSRWYEPNQPQRPVPPEPQNVSEPPPNGAPASGGETPSIVPSDAELAAYVRLNLIKAGAVLLALVLGLGFLGLYFNAELLAAAAWVLNRLGLGGLAAVLFISDAFCAPVPSDFTVLVIAKSHWSQHWYMVVPALALWSSFSGGVAWFLGTKLGHSRWGRKWFGRLQSSPHRAYAARLGKWGIAIGAVTPVPYSLTCWVAGTLELRLGEIFWVNLLRLPRFVAYYLAFAESEAILRLFT